VAWQGIAAAFNAPIAGVLFAIEFLLVDVSISAYNEYAATGALVSVIALDETILLNFKQQQNLIIQNSYVFIRCDNRFYVYLLHQKF
jgi:CIC family chloride channel protein